MIVAILIGVAGVVLVEQPHLESGNLGFMFALAAAAATAVAMLGFTLPRTNHPRAIVVHFSAVATVLSDCFPGLGYGNTTRPMFSKVPFS